MKMSAEDVLAYIGFQKEKGLQKSSICHNVTALNGLLLFMGNSVAPQCKVKYPF